MLRFDKVIYLSLLFKFLLSERLSNSLEDQMFFFSKFINIICILYYAFVILLSILLVISFARYKQYAIYTFSTFSDVLPAFTYAKIISNLWSICLEINILSPFPYQASYITLFIIIE